MNTKFENVERVIGFDCHPDSFTAAVLRGPTPAAAIVEKSFNKVPMSQLQIWAKKNTTPQDLFVLEASGNSFQVVRTLAAVGRKALVLESWHMGKLKEAHANNDRISAVRIGKAYLAGTAKEVWVPDMRTQERRDWLHAHRKATKRLTQMKARLRSYLSDNGVRLKKNIVLTKTPEAQEQIRQAREWSPRQWQVIEGILMELGHADQQRTYWRGLIAQEVLTDPQLLAIVRLCGVREMVAFALGAFVGDINRFSEPKKLVKYIGLNPAFDDSGETEWSGGVGGHGNQYLRGGCPGHPALFPKSVDQVGQETARAQRLPQPGGLCGRSQAGHRRLVLDDGPLDNAGRDRCRAQFKSRQNDQPGRNCGTQIPQQNQERLPTGNLSIP